MNELVFCHDLEPSSLGRHPHPTQVSHTTDTILRPQSKLVPKTLGAISQQQDRALDQLHSSAECNAKEFKQCLSKLKNDLSMQSFPRDPMEFIRRIDEKMKQQGKAGFSDFCKSVYTVQATSHLAARFS